MDGSGPARVGNVRLPAGLAPLEVDRDADTGAYWEPNVWLVHPELGPPAPGGI